MELGQEDVRRSAGVGSTVVGLVCYALSSSFNRLYGEWNSFKICAYIVFSSIICLAILFPKACQGWRIFEYRAHFAFLVLTSTTVYSFYLDRKLTTKPDAYAIISSAAFATMSLCMSKSIDCGFLDLMFFFCSVLITQLMEIKPLLGLVGIGVSFFLIIFRSHLDDPVEYPGSQDDNYAAIDIDSLQSNSNRTSSPDIGLLPPESSIQNFDANSTALGISQPERPPSLAELRPTMPPPPPPPPPTLPTAKQWLTLRQQPSPLTLHPPPQSQSRGLNERLPSPPWYLNGASWRRRRRVMADYGFRRS